MTRFCYVAPASATQIGSLGYAFTPAMRRKSWKMERMQCQKLPRSCSRRMDTSNWPCCSSLVWVSQLHSLITSWPPAKRMDCGICTRMQRPTMKVRLILSSISLSRRAFGSSHSWTLCRSLCLWPSKWSISFKPSLSQSIWKWQISWRGCQPESSPQIWMKS